MRPLLPLVVLAILAANPALARAETVETAFNAAIGLLEQALPRLRETRGVDVADYRDALTKGRFTSRYWGGEVAVDLYESRAVEGSCARFAAFVSLPPRNGVVRLTVCPQFFRDGTSELRRLTVLHEMVHVVAGPDECRAMAFAAQIEHLATGSHTPVERYWQANECGGAGFALP